MKLGCEKQFGLGQISGALEQQATGGTQGCISGGDSKADCLLLQRQPLRTALGTQLHFPVPHLRHHRGSWLVPFLCHTTKWGACSGAFPTAHAGR